MFTLSNKANGEFVIFELEDALKYLGSRVIMAEDTTVRVRAMQIGEYGYVGHYVVTRVSQGVIPEGLDRSPVAPFNERSYAERATRWDKEDASMDG